MSFCSSQILTWATSVHSSIGCPTDQSIGWVSGVLTSSGFLGDINNRLGTCFYLSGDSPCIVNMGMAEANIADLVYQSNFYKRKALTSLTAGGEISFTTLKEGDSTITREKSSDVAKAYRELHKGTEEEITTAIHYWTLNHTIPGSVDAQQTYGFPSP